jgi:hypothetical protein
MLTVREALTLTKARISKTAITLAKKIKKILDCISFRIKTNRFKNGALYPQILIRMES